MTPVYNLAIRLYSLGARVAAMRNAKARKLVDGQASTADYLRGRIDRQSRWLWIHAASLGEFEQGRPLIEMLREHHPEMKILLTFFSPSGYEVRKNFDQVDAVCYLPFDIKSRVREFLDIVNPCMAIFVKYEFWGNYLQELRRRRIPTYLISAIFRESQVFFKPWGGMFRGMLRCYSHIYVQDEASAVMLGDIGIHNVTVAGDTRLDRVTAIMSRSVDIAGIERFASQPGLTFVAGSSWEADEQFYMPWLREHSGVKAIIAPHEFDDERLAALCAQLPGAQLMSEYEAASRAGSAGELPRYLVVDSFGKLSTLYRYGSIAYIGGGFGAGIHNLNEAAVYGMPVVFGPNHKKFREASQLIECGGGFTFFDRATLDAVLEPLVDNRQALEQAGQRAKEYIEQNLGATRRIYDDLFA